MGLRLGGISSGLDTEALIEAMMAVERRPLQIAKQRIADLEAQKTLFGELETKLNALRDASAAIDNLGSTYSAASLDEELLAFTATSADETGIRATASGGASTGSVSVRVVSLASSARVVSSAYASDTAIVAAPGDTLDVAYTGGTISIAVGAAGGSLTDLKAAINGDPNNDGSVRADVLYDGTGYRLVVRGTQTGAANAVTLTTSVIGPNGVPFVDPAASQVAADATIEAFGLTLTRTSNTVTDLMAGVTLELRAVTANPIEISVELDSASVATKLETFATAYNEVVDFISKQSAFDETTKRAGALSGDGALRSIQMQIQRTVVDSYVFGSLNGLTDIGVRFDDEGHLSVDAEDLTAALVADPTAVRQLLGGDGTTAGLAATLAKQIDAVVKSNKGALDPNAPPPQPNDPSAPPLVERALIPARKFAIDQRIDAIELQVARLEARLAKREELIVAQFTRMEALVTQLREQGNSLGGISTLRNEN